ncbi:MAG TPA: DUF2461 domain-containing protein [Pseudonocardiaceae bacterium]
MGFSGFGERAIDFYEGLEADNSKAYWTDNKAVYDEHVQAPMAALLAALEDEFGPGKVFRPYRDVRFSKDKTPYKTHCGGVAERFHGHSYYVQLDANGMLVASGYWDTGSDQVERYRTAVADDRRGGALAGLLERLVDGGFTVEGHRLKRPPRGYDAEHPRAELLLHKTLYGARRWPPDDVLHAPECLDRVRDAWRALRPLSQWLDDHVGPSSLPRR